MKPNAWELNFQKRHTKIYFPIEKQTGRMKFLLNSLQMLFQISVHIYVGFYGEMVGLIRNNIVLICV